MTSQNIVSYFLEQSLLLHPDVAFSEQTLLPSELYSCIRAKAQDLPHVINQDLLSLFLSDQPTLDVDWSTFDASLVAYETGKDHLLYHSFLRNLNYFLSETQHEVLEQLFFAEESPSSDLIAAPTLVVPTPPQGTVQILHSFVEPARHVGVEDFTSHFRFRYETLKQILLGHSELSGALSLSRLVQKQGRESVAFIGLVVDKITTKNGNLLLTVEDPSGSAKVLVSKSKEDLLCFALDIVLDEVIGVVGVMGEGIVFANALFCPDIPVSHELKKAPDEVYAAFISDIHFGAKKFYHEQFSRLVAWLRGEYGTIRQRALAARVQYLFIVGDVVEGIGVYPKQEEDLAQLDIVAQYQIAADYLSQIPSSITLIMCGGNHDAMRLAEPQPLFDKEFCAPLFSLPNLVMVSNPSYVTIHASPTFPGFDVLLYHGYSFPYFADTVPSLAAAGGLQRCDLIMKFLLQRRHLAPTHTSNLYVPGTTSDPLVIDLVPDIFVSGHIHFFSTSTYRNITLINSGCWMSQTDYQAKRGMIPDPCKVTLCNLQSREVRVMNFLEEHNHY